MANRHPDDPRPDAALRVALLWSVVCGPVVGLILVKLLSAWAAMLVYHAGCLVAVNPLRLPSDRPRAVVLLGAAAASLIAVTVAGLALTSLVPEVLWSTTRWRDWGLAPPHDAWILAYYVGINPCVEELFWRGGMMDAQARASLGTRTSVSVSVLTFWLFHLFVLIPAYGVTIGGVASVFVLGAGVVWTLLRCRTGSVWWSAASHLGVNLGLAIVYFARLRVL